MNLNQKLRFKYAYHLFPKDCIMWKILECNYDANGVEWSGKMKGGGEGEKIQRGHMEQVLHGSPP